MIFLTEAELRDPDLRERMRQFTVIVKWMIQMGLLQRSGRNRPHSADSIGIRHFRLNHHQVVRCVARARNFIWRISESEKERSHRERLRDKTYRAIKPKVEWHYLDDEPVQLEEAA